MNPVLMLPIIVAAVLPLFFSTMMQNPQKEVTPLDPFTIALLIVTLAFMIGMFLMMILRIGKLGPLGTTHYNTREK